MAGQRIVSPVPTRKPPSRSLAVRELGVLSEQRRHIGPQPELRVLRVGLLYPLDSSHGFGALDVLHQPVDACGSAQAGAGVAGDDQLQAPSATSSASPLDVRRRNGNTVVMGALSALTNGSETIPRCRATVHHDSSGQLR